MSVVVLDADDDHLPGITAIYNHAVRETFSIWSESETTVDLRRQWMDARRAAGFPVLVVEFQFQSAVTTPAGLLEHRVPDLVGILDVHLQ